MENNDKETISLNTILVKYLRHWKLFLIVFVLSFIPAIVYLKMYPRTYEFVASVLLQEEKSSSVSAGMGNAANLAKSFGIGAATGMGINVEDEMEILASNRMQRLMILNLGVNVVYSEPYSFYTMYQEAPLKLTVDSATMANLQDEVRFTVSVSPNQIIIKTKTLLGKWNKTFTFTSLPATIKVGDDTFTLDFDHDGDRNQSFKLKIRCIPAGWMAEQVGKKLKIEDVSNASNVLTITFSDHSKQRGLDMLNSLIQTYNNDMDAYKKIENNKMMTYTDNRIEHLLADIAKVESEIQDFKKENDMTMLEADVTLYRESFNDLQNNMLATQVKANQIDLMDEFIKDPANKNKAIPSIFTIEEGEKGAVSLYNKAIVNREKILLSANENNLMVQLATKDVEILRESVDLMIENARKSNAVTLADLKNKEKQLQSKFKSIPEQEREYVAFVRDQEILNGLYIMMLQKREETVLALSKQYDRARMIEPPFIKKKPIAPRKMYACLGILALTFVIPIGYLITKDILLSIKAEYKKANG